MNEIFLAIGLVLFFVYALLRICAGLASIYADRDLPVIEFLKGPKDDLITEEKNEN